MQRNPVMPMLLLHIKYSFNYHQLYDLLWLNLIQMVLVAHIYR